MMHTLDPEPWLLLIGSAAIAAKPPHIVSSFAPQFFDPCDSSQDSSRNLRKRKRSYSEEDAEDPRRAKIVNGDVPDEEGPIRSKEKKSEMRMTGIRPPNFVYPKTAYSGHIPSMPRYSEESVLRDILVGGLGRTQHTLFES